MSWFQPVRRAAWRPPVLAAVLALLALCLFSAAAAAAGPELVCPSRVPEGEPFVARVVSAAPFASARFTWLGHSVTVPAEAGADGRWQARLLLGMGMRELLRGDGHELRVEVAGPAGTGGSRALALTVTRTPKAYPEQRLTVENKYVAPSSENLERILREQAEVNKVLAAPAAPRRYALPFLRPVPGGISSDFGLRRFFNNEPRKPHSGVDLRAAAGDPVRACADGVVLLAADHYYSGRAVYLDHGEGVLSMYFHLSRVDVKTGDVVRRGDVLGAAGATGRVTGPHLHWGVYVLGQ
ncbi:MAG: M23 family metallopeptidase, partial [Desulfovibrionaceae bacterium]